MLHLQAVPKALSKIVTPLRPKAWEHELRDHPDRELADLTDPEEKSRELSELA